MKFYYNGQLIRTSKNHIYTHAVIDTATGYCKGCRKDKATAEAVISSEIAYCEKKIADYKRAIKALEEGKNYYMKKVGRSSYSRNSYKVMLDNSCDTIENYTKWIKEVQGAIERITANWKVVELEAR